MVVLCALLLAEKGKFRPRESGGLLLGIKSGECDIFLELILDKLAIIRQHLGCYHQHGWEVFQWGPVLCGAFFLCVVYGLRLSERIFSHQETFLVPTRSKRS